MAADPYSVLGLPATASVAEVKRAYRRLAKAYHPDSAGPTATTRFLEIQQAYESITRASWRPGMRRPASSTASEPWRADPERARQADRADRTRPGTGSGEAAGPGPRSTGARRAAGADPAGRNGGGRSHSASGAGGGPAGGATGDRAGTTGTTGATGTGRRRSARRATFGSTSYDEAREQADTTWSGASWYGPTSGEYWRVNPREYADPRKHGPEYQAKAAARAARAARGEADPGEAAAAGSESAARAAAGGDGRPTSARRDRTVPPPWRAAAAPPRAAAPPSPPPPASPASSVEADASPPPPAPGSGSGVELSPGVRRLVRAAIAWPPLGVAAAAIIGEATGCASFEATCTTTAELYPWLAQAGILAALLVLPGVARILAGGTVAVALLAFPVAATLSAGGASYDRTYGPAALIAVLAVVWAIGVGAVVLRRAVTRRIP